MKSHTVPRRLLEQFAYLDPHTKSLRLWRYEKARLPYPNASPKSATRIDGHFAHPGDASKEEELEKRLAQDFEEPVNQFLFGMGKPSFNPSAENRRKLTFYVTLLFHRSEARRGATRHMQEVIVHALNQFIQNEWQVQNVAVKWSIDGLLSGKIDRLMTPDDVIRTARNSLRTFNTERNTQRSYVDSLERAMSSFDEIVYRGEWNLLIGTPQEPFIISDAPVVTWQREDESFHYGIGFNRRDLEILLPISPLACLHILPDVERSRDVRRPTTREVNMAQAAFAGRYCFSNIRSSMIDEIMQRNYGKAQLGVTAFTVWHRNYDQTFYELFMNGGRWVDPPRI